LKQKKGGKFAKFVPKQTSLWWGFKLHFDYLPMLAQD